MRCVVAPGQRPQCWWSRAGSRAACRGPRRRPRARFFAKYAPSSYCGGSRTGAGGVPGAGRATSCSGAARPNPQGALERRRRLYSCRSTNPALRSEKPGTAKVSGRALQRMTHHEGPGPMEHGPAVVETWYTRGARKRRPQMADRSVESPARQKSGGPSRSNVRRVGFAPSHTVRWMCVIAQRCQAQRPRPTRRPSRGSQPRVTAADDSRGVREGKDAMASTLLSTVAWVGDGIEIIDQTRLPTSCAVLRLSTVEAAIDAFRSLAVRGAPAIGACGA